MAGVIAHNQAIVSSANARVRITLISVPCFADTVNIKVLLPTEILDHAAFICSDPGHTFPSTVAKNVLTLSGVQLQPRHS
jgi:hypothetical protein